MNNIIKYIFSIVILTMAFCNCQPSKKIHQERLYLQGVDAAAGPIPTQSEPLIQKYEMLSITVFSDNAAASLPFNQIQQEAAGSKGASSEGASGNYGYRVDEEGNINFHELGRVHAEGLTKMQLKGVLQEKLTQFLKNPYLEIKFLNKRITVLGEVTKPGVINMPEERISILDAIALSGDITGFGRKDNILIVREENGKRTIGRLNIKDPAIFKSEYFYLHKDDMVYVEPMRQKPTGTDQTLVRNISLGASLTSVIALIYTIFKK